MTKKFISFVTITVFIMGLGITPAWSGEDETVANELTILLKASRAVLVQNKPLIKNPQKAGINADKFLSITYNNYEKATGKKFKKGSGNVGKAQDQLIQAIEQVVGDVVSGKDTALDPKGRFLPAIFARIAALSIASANLSLSTVLAVSRRCFAITWAGISRQYTVVSLAIFPFSMLSGRFPAGTFPNYELREYNDALPSNPASNYSIACNQ